MKHWLPIILLSALTAGCSRWKTNEEYLDYLASIVLGYQAKHHSLPAHFDAAHDDSGVILPNRGDKYGQALTYLRFTSDSFMFRSYGENSKDDGGGMDDLDVYYVDRVKVGRVIFLEHVRRNAPPNVWDAYKGIFRNEN